LVCLKEKASFSTQYDLIPAAHLNQPSDSSSAKAAVGICLSERTIQRWQRDSLRGDQRPIRVQEAKNRLSELERKRLLNVANSEEFGHLSPSQIVPRLADRGQYIGSESHGATISP